MKAIALVGCFLMLFAVIAAADTLQLTYFFEQPQISTGPDEKSRISIPGLDRTYREEQPVVPYLYIKVLLPQGHKAIRIEAVPFDLQKVELPGNIEKGERGFSPMHIRNVQARHSTFNKKYDPEKVLEIIGQTGLAGAQVLLARIFPVRYEEKGNRIIYTKRVKVTVETATIKDNAKGLKFRGLGSDKEKIAVTVDNPNLLKAYIPHGAKGDSWEYLIVTNDDMKTVFDEYALYKSEQFEMDAHVETIETILSSFTGDDPAQKLRNFLREAWQNHQTEWVLLGGDADGLEQAGHIVPIRCMHARAEGTVVDDCIPGDVYYANLDGHWDQNGNGLWGESDDGEGGGDVDLLSELYVGRIPADNSAEAQVLIDKIKRYDSQPAPKNALLIGELLWPLPPKVWGGDLKDLVFEEMPGMNAIRLYEEDQSFSTSALINQINSETIHIINASEHGNWYNVIGLLNTQLNMLNNDAPFFGYSHGCFSGAFDNRTVWDTYQEVDCIVEDLLTEMESGAFAFVSNSREGFANWSETGGASNEFDITFMQALFGGSYNLGKALVESREAKTGDLEGNEDANRWCFMQLNLLGDPHQPMKLFDDDDDDDDDYNNDNDDDQTEDDDNDNANDGEDNDEKSKDDDSECGC